MVDSPTDAMRRLLLAVVLGMGLGCVYTFSGNLPGYARKVYIPLVANQSERQGVEQSLTDALIRAVERDGRLTVRAEDQAGLAIRVTLTSYQREPFEYDEQGKIRTFRVWLTTRVRIQDLRKDTLFLPEMNLRSWGKYYAETETEDIGLQRAAEDLFRQILQALFASGF